MRRVQFNSVDSVTGSNNSSFIVARICLRACSSLAGQSVDASESRPMGDLAVPPGPSQVSVVFFHTTLFVASEAQSDRD